MPVTKGAPAMLLTPMIPATAFLGTYSAALVMSVEPAARFARRTWRQKRYDSSVGEELNHAPSMTLLPLPLSPATPPGRWVWAWGSSPGNALNLSWYA